MRRDLRIKRSLLDIDMDMDMDQSTEVGTDEGVAIPDTRTDAGLFTKKGRGTSVEAGVDCGIDVRAGGDIDSESGLDNMPGPASSPATNPQFAMFTKDGKQLLNPRLLGLAPKKVPVGR